MSGAWLIRVASDPRHGAGHMSRSRALGQALQPQAAVTVALDRGSREWQARLQDEGFEAVWADELGNAPWDGVVLDGYGVPGTEIASLAQRAHPFVVMDDFLSPPKQADLVVNAAIGLDGDKVGGIPALLGPRYACLDASFAEPSARPVGTVERVVINFGMADPDNATGLALDAFEQLRAQGIAPRPSVVASSRAPHYEALRQRLDGNAQVELLTGVSDMAALLRGADLVVGAGGVSLFERLALGVPSVTLTIADNQKLFVRGAVARGATVDGGTWYRNASHSTNSRQLAACVGDLIADRSRRAALRAAGRALVDGRGAERVAAYLLNWPQSAGGRAAVS